MNKRIYEWWLLKYVYQFFYAFVVCWCKFTYAITFSAHGHDVRDLDILLAQHGVNSLTASYYLLADKFSKEKKEAEKNAGKMQRNANRMAIWYIYVCVMYMLYIYVMYISLIYNICNVYKSYMFYNICNVYKSYILYNICNVYAIWIHNVLFTKRFCSIDMFLETVWYSNAIICLSF